MSDVLLERIAQALEKIAANGGAAPATVAPEVATQPPAVTGNSTVTADTLLQIVQPLVQNEATKAKVKEVLTKYNLNRLGEAQESQYAALYAEFTAITAGGGVAPKADEGLI